MSSVSSIEVEPSSTITEKMQSPTYYDSKKVAACVGESEAGNSEVIATALNAKAVSNSNFVSVVYRAVSRDKALRCLEQVLIVVENQKYVVDAYLASVMSDFDNEKKTADELGKAVKELGLDIRVQSKDVNYLVVAARITAMHEAKKQLMAIERKIYEMERMLEPAFTQDAKFLTPIFVSEQRVSPNRSGIVIISAMASMVFGVLVPLSRRAFASVKKPRRERLKSASITP